MTLLAVFCSRTVFAITFINQTGSKKEIKIVESYRPKTKKQEELVAPKSLGYPSKKITIPPYSMKKVLLSTEPTVLVISILNKKIEGLLIEQIHCFEPYKLENQQEDKFNDDWGFVIHNPIGTKFLSPGYQLLNLKLEMIRDQGYGIKCFHPLLFLNITSLKKLPKEFEFHFDGEVPLKRKIIN